MLFSVGCLDGEDVAPVELYSRSDGVLAWLTDTLLGRELMPDDVRVGERYVDAVYHDDNLAVRWTRDGRLSRTIAQRGDGPGELRGPTRLFAMGDTLMVVNGGRFDEVLPDGTFGLRIGHGGLELCDNAARLVYCGAMSGRDLLDVFPLDSYPVARQFGAVEAPAEGPQSYRMAPAVLSDSQVVVLDLALGVLHVLDSSGHQSSTIHIPSGTMRSLRRAVDRTGATDQRVLKNAFRIDDRRVLVLASADHVPVAWSVDVVTQEVRPVLPEGGSPSLGTLLRRARTVRAFGDELLIVTLDSAGVASVRRSERSDARRAP